MKWNVDDQNYKTHMDKIKKWLEGDRYSVFVTVQSKGHKKETENLIKKIEADCKKMLTSENGHIKKLTVKAE